MVAMRSCRHQLVCTFGDDDLQDMKNYHFIYEKGGASQDGEGCFWYVSASGLRMESVVLVHVGKRPKAPLLRKGWMSWACRRSG